MSKLKRFIEKNKWEAYMLTIIGTTDGKEYLQISDNHSQYLNREELKLIVDELSKTLELDSDLDRFIDKKMLLTY